jgi:hypothetical protein
MTGSWTKAAQSPHRARPVCALVDGRLLYFGEAYGNDLPDAWLYDPTTDTFVEQAKPPWQAWSHQAIGTAEGWVAMVGGSINNRGTTRCSLFEPATNSWHEMPPMPEPRHGHRLELVGGRIVVLGGAVEQNGAGHRNVWSWAPGEDWRIHPELPEGILYGLDAVGLVDGSLAAWSRRIGHDLIRLVDDRWTSLGGLDVGVEILPTSDGLLAIGGTKNEQTDRDVRRWSPAGWTTSASLARPRCYARSARLVDGRAIVCAGERHDRYMEENSSGGELDIEYRSFSSTEKYGLVACQDMELETPDGWISVKPPFEITGSNVIDPLPDGRLLIAQRYGTHQYGETKPIVAYLWTPPSSTSDG